VRHCFEQRFTSRRMAQDYLDLFSAAIGSGRAQSAVPLMLTG
jgi:hypothetical protein